MKKWLKCILCFIVFGFLLWMIDWFCILTIHRPLLAIQKDKNMYVGILYDTYKCSEYTVPQIKAKGTKFSCMDDSTLYDGDVIFEETGVDKVRIAISDVSLTGVTLIIEDMNQTPYIYGEWYEIEKEVDGNWYPVETKIEHYGFNDIGYVVNEEHKVKFVIDWEWLYGSLPLGSYRIVKQVNQQYIYVGFSIATTS